MRLEFDATLSDLRDVSFYSCERLGMVRSQRLTAGVLTGLMAAAAIYFLEPFLGHPDLFWVRVLLGLVGLVFGVIFGYLYHPHNLKHAIKRQCKALYGTVVPIRVVVEITSERVRVEQLGTTYLHEWSVVEGIDQTERAYIILMRFGLVVAVPFQAFPWVERMDEFERLIDRYIGRSRSGDT